MIVQSGPGAGHSLGKYPAWILAAMLSSTAVAQTPRLPDDLGEVSRAILTHEHSCVSLIRGYFGRIVQHDQSYRSVIALNKRALNQARGIDRLTDEKKKVLSLICAPLLVKDNIDVAGMATTAGSRALKRNRALRDAFAVQALRADGAIVVAKTNMSEFAFNYRGRSSIRGQTRNPLDLRLSAGGSSSGNAAALAAGFGLIALGTYTSGSIRVPVALTGTVGLRPTFGLVPTGGVLPLSPSQDVIGPMCRLASDCGLMMALLSPAFSRGTVKARPLHGLRVGVLHCLFPPDAATDVQRIEAILVEQGAIITEKTLADEDVLVGALPPAGYNARFASRSIFDFSPVMDRYLLHRRGTPQTFAKFLSRLRARARDGSEDRSVLADVEKFAANWARAGTDEHYSVNGPFRDGYVSTRIAAAFREDGHNQSRVDLLIYPSVQTSAASLEKGPDTKGTHRLAAYSGYPAVSVPLFWRDGLPVSIELLGRRFDDGLLLAAAAAVQAMPPPPPESRVR